MEQTVLTCEQVDERNLEAGYLAGRLSEEDATAFEAHFFGCERCWAMLQTAQAVTADRRKGGSANRRIGGEADRRTVGARRRGVWFSPLAAAATLVLLAGGWWVMRQQAPVPTETFRGRDDVFLVLPWMTSQGMTGHFTRVAGADVYRVRIFSPAGDVLGEQETSDTTFTIPVPPGTAALVQVTALDALRQPLVSSGLVSLVPPPLSP